MTSTALAPAPPRRLPSKRLLWWVVPIVVVLAILTFLNMRNASSEDPLSPRNAQPEGAQAMARVLEQQGVTVRTPTTADALDEESLTSGTTVVVTNPNRLGSSGWERFRTATDEVDRIVLIRPDTSALAPFGIEADIRGSGLGFASPASCDLPLARGLSLEAGGRRYAPRGASSDLTVCFPESSGSVTGGDRSGTLLHAPATDDRPEVIAIGSTDVIMNSAVEEGDNAALGLRALGGHDRLIWWNVGVADIDYAKAPPARFPEWVAPAWGIALMAIALMMIARGRRLGKLVTEPLPVVVRADETTRARGQIYRRAGDLERASIVLRSATTRRLATYLRVNRDREELISAVAIAAHRDEGEINHLLRGRPPTSESELSTLARQLHDLEREIRPR
ncbi:DUF4350 domain-containing protein [Demetria terragena]|uniref:DUF4350 domain-containing protein n=1 Tax=Demetria terragena TaxID=63959 RepID=UPI0012EAEBEB|nr:DUF4350 domain-containing protein [Demetria terragena]